MNINDMRYARITIANRGATKRALPENISPNIIKIGKNNNIFTDLRDSFRNNQIDIQKKKSIDNIYDIKLDVSLIIQESPPEDMNRVINT